MYLKTLELQGFKSFPDKTVIEFDKGMTAIVGANGSGKSNISDAVRWVLGEMSAKSLRGNKMEDVIFNGSSKRKAASFAEVIMTIDNSDYLMKIDYDEVSVGRRLYRTGESEYFLNRQKVRLKDVVDLFLNTGIGREGYSVISQGKIAEIISLKGNERRELFEEAAGISRFRYRKNEAAAKLETVNENAVRINDILSEVQARIPKLAEQSKKAKAYLEIVSEKRGLELGIWSKRIFKINETGKNLSTELSEKEKMLSDISDEIEKTDSKIDAMYIESQKKNMESEMLRTEINAVAGEANDAAARLSVLENEIHHFDSRKKEIEELSLTRDLRKEKLISEKENADNTLKAISEKIESLYIKEKENTAAIEEIIRRNEELSASEIAVTEEKNAASGNFQSLSLKHRENEGIGFARLERQKVLSEQKKNLLVEKEESENKLSSQRKALEEKEKALSDARIQNGKINMSIMKEKEAFEEKENSLGKLKLTKLEKEKHRDTLQRMERLLEGFSESVREVMQAKDKFLSGICGPISKIISADEEYITAIETALGGNIQNVIVEDENSAKEAINYLKSTKSGRATFLPLSTVKGGKWRCDNIKEKGFIGIASELCSFDEKYTPAVEHLLGKVVVCDTLETAIKIAKGENFGVKTVTLDGQIINAGGSFTGGQAQAKSGVISRTRDIKNLNEEIEKTDAEITRIKEELAEKEKRLSNLRREEKESADIIEEGIAAVSDLKNALLVAEAENRIILEKLAETEKEESEISEFALKKEEMLREYESEKAIFDEKVNLFDKKLSEIAAEKEKNAELRENAMSEKGRISALITSETERLENAATAANDIYNRLEEIEKEGEDAEKTVKETEEAKLRALEEIKLLSEKKEELLKDAEKKRASLEALTLEISLIGEKSNEMRISQKDRIAEKEKLLDETSRKRGALSGMEKEKNDIIQKLAEEYEMDIESEEFISARNTDTDSLGGESHLSELRRRIRNIGPVNTDSVEELREAEERFKFLSEQYNDITTSKEELEKLIFDLEGTMREMFSETFESIRFSFREIFTELFGGGMADIELADKDDLLNCGVEIKVQPPGKVIKNLSLLSGGEQAFVAIALYMALLRINPSPFCIFDEIESALDEANVKRFAQYIKKHNDKTQFIVITHRRGTMEEADTLYGIAMQEKGVSDFLRLEADSISKFASDNK